MHRRQLLLSLALMLWASLAGTAAAPAHDAAGAAGLLRYAIRPEGPWPNPALTAARSQVVILLPWQQALMRRLKAANPSLIVLEYKDLSNSSAYGPVDGFSTDGVTYAQARSEHPDWLLRDGHGNPIRCRNFPYLWAMDIGNPGFQRAWAAEVSEELSSQGWDGVFLDNVDPTIRYYHDPADVPEYPNDAAYAAATTAALAAITPKIHAAGKLVMANIGSWPNYEATGMRWLQYLDGAMDERFAKFTDAPGEGYRSLAEWRAELAILTQTQREGKWFLGIAQSSDDDVAAARYGWATMLLGAGGRASFALQDERDYGIETWFGDYEAPLGVALGPATEAAPGAYRRYFSGGVALVNATASARTVRLDALYAGDGVPATRSVRMAAHTGLILTRAGGDSGNETDAPTTVSAALGGGSRSPRGR